MGGKGVRPLIKRSGGKIIGSELRSLINMISKSKPWLPLLFAAGGLNRITAFNLVPEKKEKCDFVALAENNEFVRKVQNGDIILPDDINKKTNLSMETSKKDMS